MKFKICHETRLRLRVQLLHRGNLSLEDADRLEAWCLTQHGIKTATVHERTQSIIVTFDDAHGAWRSVDAHSSRREFIEALSRFSFDDAEVLALSVVHSGRKINRQYEEQLVMAIASKCIHSLFVPVPIRTALTIIRSARYIKEAVKCLVERKLHVELLDGLSILISMIRGDFATAGSVMFLLKIGEILDEWTHKKSIDDLARCMSLNIDKVWVVDEGDADGSRDRLVSIASIRQGDKIRLRMGTIVPLDGVVVEGEAMVNQASLTGEPIAVAKRPSTAIYAGTVVEEGSCIMAVSQASGQSRYDRIVSMIEASEQLKSTVENRAAALANKLVPYTLASSALAFLLTQNVARALSVLMVDFSCALKLAMPLAVLSAMREAVGYHITVKGGKFLETVAKVDTIVLDKTGTLTHATPVVADVISFGHHEKDEMLRIAACLEEHFPHSMANAVVRAAHSKSLQHEEMHSRVDYLVAHGIASQVDDQRVIIGSAHFVFEDEKCTIPPGEQARFDALDPQYSHLYLAIGGELAAVIYIADPLRDEARDVIEQLRKLGIRRTVMLTGDSERTAAAIAAQVGVDEYHSEVLPEDKANYVQAERDKGHTVLMLGDGINDAPAMSAASIGVAIDDGAAIAREVADITIAGQSLYELVILRRLSTALLNRIQSNYHFVIGFNGALIALGVAGLLPPATSALCHNASTIGVSLHSMTDLIDN